MWTIFKVFIEFVTILLLFYVWVLGPQGMWDLSSLSRGRTSTPCIGRWSLNHWTQGKSLNLTFFKDRLFYVFLDSSGRPNQDEGLSPHVPQLHNQPLHPKLVSGPSYGLPTVSWTMSGQQDDQEDPPLAQWHPTGNGDPSEKQRGNTHEQEEQTPYSLQTQTPSPGHMTGNFQHSLLIYCSEWHFVPSHDWWWRRGHCLETWVWFGILQLTCFVALDRSFHVPSLSIWWQTWELFLVIDMTRQACHADSTAPQTGCC